MRSHCACRLITRRLAFTIAACAAVIFAGVEFYRCVFRYDNDFLWHRNLGVDFLNDQVYETFAYHYPPARAMIDAATAWLPYRVDRAIWLVVTCAGLAWCVRFWSTIGAAPSGAGAWPPVSPWRSRAATSYAICPSAGCNCYCCVCSASGCGHSSAAVTRCVAGRWGWPPSIK